MSTDYEFVGEVIVDIAHKIIEESHAPLGSAKIAYLFKEKAAVSKGKPVLGTAYRPNKREQALHDYDFVIVLAEDIWGVLSDTQRKMVIDHELCHCISNDKGEWAIAPHDFEEFECIVERYKEDTVTLSEVSRKFFEEREAE